MLAFTVYPSTMGQPSPDASAKLRLPSLQNYEPNEIIFIINYLGYSTKHELRHIILKS